MTTPVLRHRARHRARVLVISLDWPQTASLLAALDHAGFSPIVLTEALPDRLGLGRYCEQRVAPDPKTPEFEPFIRDQVMSIDADWVLPVCEPVMELLWDMSEQLPIPVYPNAAAWQREAFADRRSFYRLASRAGIPIPRAIELHQRADVDAAAQSLGFPFVVRGTSGFGGAQVRICHDLAQAVQAYERLETASEGEVFAQQYISGERCLFGGLFDRGRTLQYFAQQTLETYPTQTSPSIRVRSSADPKLIGLGKSLFEALEWNGLACAEFIRDSQGGYVLLEANPRPWAAIQAAARCGCDLLDGFVTFLATGEAPPQSTYRADVDCVLFPQFITARIHAGRFPDWRDWRHYLKSLRAAPWSQPALMLHLLRRIYRAWASRPKRSPAVSPVCEPMQSSSESSTP